MQHALDNAGTFLVQIISHMALLVFTLRILLRWHRANHANPICQLIGKLTTPLVRPFKQLIPEHPRVDIGATLWVFIICAIQIGLLNLIKFGHLFLGFAYIPAILILALSTLLSIFFYAILFSVILSWINPGVYNPVSEILYIITEPLLKPFRRLIPPISGFDISPIFAIISIKLVEIFLYSMIGRL